MRSCDESKDKSQKKKRVRGQKKGNNKRKHNSWRKQGKYKRRHERKAGKGRKEARTIEEERGRRWEWMNDRWRDRYILEMKQEMKRECKIDLPAAPYWTDHSISPSCFYFVVVDTFQPLFPGTNTEWSRGAKTDSAFQTSHVSGGGLLCCQSTSSRPHRSTNVPPKHTPAPTTAVGGAGRWAGLPWRRTCIVTADMGPKTCYVFVRTFLILFEKQLKCFIT